ncbi:putative helicase [Curtobacterium sp. PhB142]|uniref:DEAD/DEAH box helicase n=1 Tax=unclassified Curtobacterium TaxID=257496 RepID=UPI00104D827F|nr:MULTISPECIES: type ISP restriction/modification enzyme [unclassified Curtobacterium]TCL85302.1 putative helicase [Curtobacterium sp. PhB142]TCM01767.1 putative helicase [Curtobacterium sp. PhB134]
MAMSIHDLLDVYATIAPDKRTKGRLFERLTRAYLTTDPKWTARFDEVWLWQDWPDRNGKTDTGIDLVARERHGGGLCAIQCKFHDAGNTVQKGDLDSFFTASGKAAFSSRLIVATAPLGKNALEALVDQQLPTAQIPIEEFEHSGIDWSEYSFDHPDSLAAPQQKMLRQHQVEALNAVRAGFAESARGKLIMACGTGKTFTSLRIAEDVAGRGGNVLFLVPSIALLSQTLREWSQERAMPLRAFAVCSDSKVGRVSEDFTVADLAYPATTNTKQLLTEVAKSTAPDGLTVFFSTYQSIDVIAKAQAEGLADFDLVICDEAHRTAGFIRQGAEESAFLRVHSDESIQTQARLYMTATPKIYAESARSQADENAAVLYSMDDEAVFGPVFHRLGFGEAVERDLLTDYRVLVLTIDEDSIGSAFQETFAADGELNIPDAARIVGIYNGLAKRGVQGIDTTAPNAHKPLRRAVAFSRSIADSKTVRGYLNGYDGVDGVRADSLAGARIDRNADGDEQTFRLEADHVDGGMNILERNQKLDWLKADTAGENVCRILTNARCLSEGVDVPSLDAVIFLNSRDSPVDVVQSVGRVMRKAPGKDYGYIVLPIAVPAGQSPEQALNDNTKFKVVWDVLRALRAHDERFEAKIEQIDLNGRTDTGPVIATNYTDADLPEPAPGTATPETSQIPLDMSILGADWQNAIYARIVDKVGERDYWENWAKDVAEIAGRQIARITSLVDGSNESLHTEFTRFVKGLQDNLNPGVTEPQAIEMLSQHLITQPVFDALFAGHAFSDHNPVSQVMQRMVDALEEQNLTTETSDLAGFYAGVQRTVAGISDASGRQTIIKRLYEKFFTGAFRGTSERLGIVYTPNEIVDFILRSADRLSRDHFGAGLTDHGVHVLDPFTGTGTFIVRLLQSGLITPADLAHKYRHELHANEIVLLAYYVAAVNIEATYNSLQGGKYVPFPGVVLTDTFQTAEDDDTYDDQGVFGDNNERVKQQNALDIRVIVGNPPYSSGQDSANDNNQNLKYPYLDKRIANTYAARSTGQNKNSLYDSYIRAIRWASDRIKDHGIVAYVTNGGFLDGNTAAGLRLALQDEFTELYILNLRGNQRTAGEESRREGGKVFGSGSRASVAISLLVKNPDRSSSGAIHYRDIGDYLSRDDKLGLLEQYGDSDGVPWQQITPNNHGDWINQRNDAFETFTAIGDRKAPESAIFRSFSAGLQTNRDAWVYNSSAPALRGNVTRMIDAYNAELDRWQQAGRPQPAEDFIDTNPERISWTSSLLARFKRDERISVNNAQITTAMYRPFSRQQLYFDPRVIHRPAQHTAYFPSGERNHGIYLTAPGAGHAASALSVDAVPDLALWGSGSGQFFPRYVYDAKQNDGGFAMFDGPQRRDNITDTALARYRKLYGQEVTGDDVFFAVYGLLHSEDYRREFDADLKKMLPRIPELTDTADFQAFAAAGRALSELHIGYESADLYPVELSGPIPADLRVTKVRYGGKAGNWDRTVIHVASGVTISGIPAAAHEYKLGSRSALDWILERYQVKTDKASGIVNDPNDWGAEHGNSAYIVELIQRIVTVSVETVRIVAALPALDYRSGPDL